MRSFLTVSRALSFVFYLVFLGFTITFQSAPLCSSTVPIAPLSPLELDPGAHPDIYAEENGALHVAWKNGNNLQYRYFTGSSWLSTETVPIGNVGVSSKSPPSLCADSNGDPHIVWTADNSHVFYGNGSWGGQYQISSSRLTAKRPHIALDGNDDLHVIWRGRGGPGNGYEVFYRKWTDGTWGNSEMVTYTTPSCAEDAHIAVDGSNTRYVIWEKVYRYDSGSGWSEDQVFDTEITMPDVFGEGQCAYIGYRKNYRFWYIAVSSEGDPPSPEHWITVTSPVGGETWEPGSTNGMSRESSPGVDSVNISCSTDGGYTWSMIEGSTLNDGSFDWEVPDTPSEACRVKIEDANENSFSEISDADFTVDVGGSAENLSLSGARVSHEFGLFQNYPNPFDPNTQIRFNIPGEDNQTSEMEVVKKIYDSRGKHVRDLLDESLPPGSYRTHWDDSSDSGDKAPSGICLLSIRAGSRTAIRKMVLAR